MERLAFLWFLVAAAVAAQECNEDNCKLPACSCFTTDPPADIPVEKTPQFVIISFDGGINDQNMPFYRDLLFQRKNKGNGCKMAATFFVTHEYLNYIYVHELYTHGNEIAVHSISGNPRLDYWKKLNQSGWEAEMAGHREIISKFGNIPKENIAGMRVPFLQTGGDPTFKMLHENGFLYDSSLPFRKLNIDDYSAFPYTLDHSFQGECTIKPCPEDVYPGLWESPLNYIFRSTELEEGVFVDLPCSMVDKCLPPEDEDTTFNFLKRNFEEYYDLNRAPFPLFLREPWLRENGRKEGFLRFIDWLLGKEDVFFVNLREVIEYMKNPKPLKEYQQKTCLKEALTKDCRARQCNYEKTALGGYRMMPSCVPCPKNYPWLHNPGGR